MEWTTLAGVVLGGALTILAASIERRHDRRTRIEEAREKRVAVAAEIIARLELLLSDADPQRLGMNIDPSDPFGAYKPLEVEWRTTLRPQLAAYALADPSAEVRERGQALITEVWNSLAATGWHLGDLAGRRQSGADHYELAKEHHSESQRLSREFMALVRGDDAH